MRLDPRFLQQSGIEAFTGAELLIKGALEAEGGTHLLTGYPGSPIAGLFYVGCDAGGFGLGTHQALDSAVNVSRLVLAYHQTLKGG